MNLRIAGYQKRIAALFARQGESVTLHSGGGTQTITALFTIAASQLTSEYFDPNEAVDLVRPVLAAYLDPSASAPMVGDFFTRDSRQFTIRRVGIYRASGQPLLLVALCD